MDNKLYKDIAKEELLGKLNDIIENKDKYQVNDIFRIRFLKKNIDEVVSVILAKEASRLVENSEEYKNILKEYGLDFALIYKDKKVQEKYEEFGYEEKLPTMRERKELIRNQTNAINYLENHNSSAEYIETVKSVNQLELDLFDCKRGELNNQFSTKLIVKISNDVFDECNDNISKAKEKYEQYHIKVKKK